MKNEEAIEWLISMYNIANQINDCFEYKETLDMAIKALKIVQGIEDAYMRELLKTPLERGVPVSDVCDGCRYELNSTNGNPCYSCSKHKEGE